MACGTWRVNNLQLTNRCGRGQSGGRPAPSQSHSTSMLIDNNDKTMPTLDDKCG